MSRKTQNLLELLRSDVAAQRAIGTRTPSEAGSGPSSGARTQETAAPGPGRGRLRRGGRGPGSLPRGASGGQASSRPAGQTAPGQKVAAEARAAATFPPSGASAAWRTAQALRRHAVVPVGWLAAMAVGLVLLPAAGWVLGVRHGRGGEARAAEGDLARGPLSIQAPRPQAPRPQEPGVMQRPAGGGVRGGGVGRQEAVAGAPMDAVPTTFPPSGRTEAVPRQRLGLPVVSYSGRTRSSEQLAEAMKAHMEAHGITGVHLVHDPAKGLLFVLVEIPEGGPEAAGPLREKIRALPPPPTDRGFSFREQPLHPFTFSLRDGGR